MNVQPITPVMFMIHGAPALDPVTVVLNDPKPGFGQLIVECYGKAWSAYWTAMGDRKLAQFLIDSDSDYISTRMAADREKKTDARYRLRIIEAVQAALRQEAARVSPQNSGEQS